MKKQEMQLIDKLVKQGKSVNWPNHYWAGGTAAEDEFGQITLQFFMERDINAYLKNLGTMFSSYKQNE